MPRGPSDFKQRNLRAALLATRQAGVSIARVEVDRAGKIVIVTGKPGEGEPAPSTDSAAWDDLLKMTTLRRLRYTHSFVDRHGHVRHFARVPGRKQVPLRGRFGDAQFMSDYHAALADAPRKEIGAERTRPGSVSQTIIAYYRDNSFTSLAAGTRAMRRAILEQFRQEQPPGTVPFGKRPLAPLRQQHIAVLLGRKKPFAVRNWLKTLRGLMQFAVATGRIDMDPTLASSRRKHGPAKSTVGLMTRSLSSRRCTRSALAPASPWRCCSTRHIRAVILCN
jgi:hypothetical protein